MSASPTGKRKRGASDAAAPAKPAKRPRRMRPVSSEVPLPPEAIVAPAGLARTTAEFWSAKQREGSSLHTFPYYACFKRGLPWHYITKFTAPGDVVYDPFMGRGTTLIEAALLGRVPWGSDINPLSDAICAPRLAPPTQEDVDMRLATYDLAWDGPLDEDLLAFYHEDTLRELCALRRRFLEHEMDDVDRWIRMCVLARLTGHSQGYLSVWTQPPNQCVTVQSQRRRVLKRGLVAEYRNLRTIVSSRTAAFLAGVTQADRDALAAAAPRARIVCAPAAEAPFPDASVDLVVTSPPFLAAVDYAGYNWLRCWFVGVDAIGLHITSLSKPTAWAAAMLRVLKNLARVLKPTGHIAFEVGEVRGPKGATVNLDEIVAAIAPSAGLEVLGVEINQQKFSKLADAYIRKGKGTTTNRVVILRRAPALASGSEDPATIHSSTPAASQ